MDKPMCCCDKCEQFRYYRKNYGYPKFLTMTESKHNLKMALGALGHELMKIYRIDRFLNWLSKNNNA